MNKDIEILKDYWLNYKKDAKDKDLLLHVSFEKIINSLFGVDSFYYYVIDFYDKSISHISQSIEEIHGLCPKTTTFNDIIKSIHPEDLNFVLKAEAASLDFIFENIDKESILNYKKSYNFRAKMKNNEYALFNHQALILSLDENGECGVLLNIHTRIDHLNTINSNTYSLIGLNGNPSYLNLQIEKENIFSRREIDIIKLIVEGYNNEEIAERLFISALTVKKHRSNILNKSECKNIAQLVKKSILSGII